LAQLLPDLRLTIRSSVPLAHLRSRITHEFHHMPEAVDPGMEMVSALEVDAERSFRAYANFHGNWEARVAAESRLIAALSPDAILSNVAYLPLEGAVRLGIPAIAMCSLNWADIFGYFCGHMREAMPILKQVQQAYLQANAFLRLSPAMPMAWLPRMQTLAPVAQPRTNHRAHINEKLDLAPQHKLVLVSMGGIAMRLPVESWPRIPDVIWLVPESWGVQREDCIPMESTGLGFSDLLASCDAMLTKPGYGSFVEAACAGVPVLYVMREDWPEQDALISWLDQHGVGAELQAVQLQTGGFAETLQLLLGQAKPQPALPSGAQEAAQYLKALLVP
jgi:UDP:flavonoid glycosyltransferase YjiC (YdhE family)